MPDLQTPGAGRAYQKEFDRALAFQKQGRIEDATVLYRVLIERYPKAAEAYINLGNLLIDQRRFERARQHFSTAVDIAPHLVEAHNGLAISLNRLGDKDAAADRLKVALGIAPNNPHVLNNLANILREGGKRDEAEKMYRATVSIDPKFAAAHHSLGVIARQRCDFAAAVRNFEDAVAAQADYAEAHFSLGMARLTLGEFKGGWPEYEWRWKCGQFPGRQITGTPWQGQNLSNKTLLLHAEQGYGDTIQFFRFAEMLKRRGTSIIAYCQRQLKRVVETIPGIDTVIAEGEPVPTFDYYVAALSVPAVLDIGLPDLPGRIPYVKEPTGYDRRFDMLLSATESTVRIGFAWAGRASHENDRQRSCPPDQFRQIMGQSDISLISLQRDRPALTGDFAASIVDTAALLDDFGDTAALIERLDLVITVDTAVAHLAGAMGKPVWVLLPYIPDWRWMLEVAESPWYPTARLFRQPAPGDWPSVFAEVDRQLAELRRSRSENRTDTEVIELASAFKLSDGTERFVMP
ncbi:MAG: tetratricopeptide repeat protein, partial [Alphaproteobacteria bacterium]|nr:tetratricopeptide repeat protein [Alphaproteobacteria bacterium]